jgi:ribose transport system permease protein
MGRFRLFTETLFDDHFAAGLTQIGAQEPARRFVTGCVIVVAVIVDAYRKAGRSSTK